MRWRPRLVLRLGRHGVASSTSGLGHLLDLLVAAVIALGAAAAHLASSPSGRTMPFVLLACLALLARTVKDGWAWVAASDRERASFRAAVEAQRPWTPPEGYAPILDANRWRRATSALVLAALAGTAAAARWHAELLVPAMFAAAFVAAGGLELRPGRAFARPSAA